MLINEINLNNSQLLFLKYFNIQTSKDSGIRIEFIESSHLKLEIFENEIKLYYGKISEIFRGLALLKEKPQVGAIYDQPSQFDTLAAFCDCSRNAVLKVEAVKEYILNIAALGYNRLFLYTEDTFEVPEYKYFGHYRGRYSADEIRELDAFAKEYGIELVPAIQTLAHFNQIFHWKQFEEIHDATDMLLCGNEKTYEFLDKMIASIRSMYSTNIINIGMDEAHMLGLGKYLEENGYTDKMDIFLKHIDRVYKIVRKYGFEPMMWSDMFFKIATGCCTYKALEAVDFNNDVLDMIPENMSLVYWNYSPQGKEYYDSIIDAHLSMKRKIIFAGGCRKWVGISPNYSFSLEASRMALSSIAEHGIKDVILTAWGDDGAEGSVYLTLPLLALYSEKCYTGEVSDNCIDNKVSILFGYTFKEFMLLESANFPTKTENQISSKAINAAKVILWNDPLCGQYDKHILNGTNEYYVDLVSKLKPLKDRDNRYNFIFETMYLLCDFLSIKAEIGNRLRSAYKSNDIETLKQLSEQIMVIIEKLDVLHKGFRDNWLKENKIFGFDVQDIRFGALRARLEYASDVINNFICGKIITIPELEVEPLYMDCREEYSDKPSYIFCNNWKQLVTVNAL